MDERLSWIDHINYIKRKMLSGMFAINAVKLFVPARILWTLHTLVYLHILYGIRLWSAAYEIHLSKVNVLHKKIIRSMCNVNYNDHTNELFVQLGILKLHDIVIHQLGIFMFRHVSRNLPNPLLSIFNYIYEVHKHNTRISSHIRPIWARLNILKKSMLYVGPSLWNSLDEQLTFKISRLFKKYLQLSYKCNSHT